MNTPDRTYEIIVELYANELSIAKIAKEFGVTKNYIYMINCGKSGKMDNYKYPIRDRGYATHAKPLEKKENPTDIYGMEL